MTPLVAKLRKTGMLQPHHGFAASWLQEEPMRSPAMAQLAQECFECQRRTPAWNGNLLRTLFDLCRRGRMTAPNDITLGMVREGLNAVYRIARGQQCKTATRKS